MKKLSCSFHSRVNISQKVALCSILALFGFVSAEALESVEESAPFSLNLDGRESIAERAPQDYVIWLAEFFTTGDLFDFDKVGEEADPDFDGKSNRFEFLAKLNPRDGDEKFQIRLGADEAGSFVEFNPLKTGVRFLIETSDDLGNWMPVAADGLQRVDDTIRLELESNSRLEFFRIELLSTGFSN